MSAEAEMRSGGVTGTRCFSPQVESMAPGRQMRIGVYQLPSLFLGWGGWTYSHSPAYIQAYQLFGGQGVWLNSSAFLSQEDTFIFPVTRLDQHMSQNKLKWKNVGWKVFVYFPTCEFVSYWSPSLQFSPLVPIGGQGFEHGLYRWLQFCVLWFCCPQLPNCWGSYVHSDQVTNIYSLRWTKIATSM